MFTKPSLKSARTLLVLVVVTIFLAFPSLITPRGWHSRAAQRGATPATTRQESRKSTTAPKMTTSKSSGAAKGPKTTARKRSPSSGRQKGTSAATTAETATAAPKGSRERRVSDTTTATGKTASSPAATAKPGRCDPEKDEHIDLSGSYSGVINYPAAGMTGPATLTVTGNRFTLNSGSKTEMGNITAVVTCNYTAVAMMFGQWKTPQPGEPVMPPLPMLSLTATKKGDQLILKPAPSERREFLFEPASKK